MAEIGDIIGQRYLLTGELGQGAMSVVYSAIDQKLGREVAVKMLWPHLARQPEAVMRFQREAAAVAQLDDHPNIVRIFDYSGPDVTPAYLVMELVEGVNLATFMAKNPNLWPDLAALLVEPLTAALSVAHGRQIIHRDIKLENIMVSKNGQLKLVDFGIARAADAATITATGSLMGSPAYMAPEYLNGEPADFTADIYSIGVLLYHLATGHLPYEAPTPAALFKRVCEGRFIPAEQIEPRLTRNLNNIIQKAMALNKGCRYQSAKDMQGALKSHLQTLGLADKSLADYLAAPQQFAEQQLNRWLDNLTHEAQVAAKKGRTSRALSCYQLILAFRPDDESILLALKKLQSWLKVRGQLPKIALGIVILATSICGGLEYHNNQTKQVISNPDEKSVPMIAVAEVIDQTTDSADSQSEVVTSPLASETVWPIKKTDLPATQVFNRSSRHGKSIGGKGRTEIMSSNKNRIRAVSMGPHPVVGNRNASTEKIGRQELEELSSSVTIGQPLKNDEELPISDQNKVVPIEVTLHAFPFASIWVDGQQKAKNAMNPLTLSLTPGNHELRFEHPAALPQQRTITLEKGQNPTQIKVHMEPLPASLVIAAPKGTIVELDNKRWLTLTDGNNEARLIELPDKQFRRSYKITLTEPGQEPWSKIINLTAGQVTTVGRRE